MHRNDERPDWLKSQTQSFKQEFIDIYVETKLPALLNQIAGKIKHYLDCEEVSMFLYYAGKQELHFEVATGDMENTLKTIILKKGTGIVGWVADNRESVISNDPANDPRFAAGIDREARFVTRSLAAVPVESDGQLIGVLEAVNHKDDGFKPDHLALLQSISHLIAIPLHNAMLFHITQEEKEQKQQLLNLGNDIAASLEPEKIFKTVKTFTETLVNLSTFYIGITKDNTIHDLVHDTILPWDPQLAAPISPNPFAFQTILKASEKEFGFLRIQTPIPIPPEAKPLLEGLSTFTTIAISRHENHLEMIEKQRYDNELKLAQKVQERFLPQDPIDLEKLQVAFKSIPSTKISGDYYDIIPLNNDETLFTVNDISGHGIAAAQIMAIFSATFKHKLKESGDILETLEHLHDLFCQKPCLDHHVTSFTAIVNTAKRTITYTNCGHEYPVLIRGEGSLLLSEGPTPIGFPKTEDFQLFSQPIEPGDIIALFTDGVTEAQNPAQEEYQTQNLITCIKQHRLDTPREILDSCIAHLKKFTQKEQFQDDISLMIIKVE